MGRPIRLNAEVMFLFSLKLNFPLYYWPQRSILTPFLGEAMYVSLSKRKIEIGNIVLVVNPKFWKKDGRFVPNAIIRPSGDES